MLCTKGVVVTEEMIQAELAVYKSDTSKNCGPDKKKKNFKERGYEGSAAYCCLGKKWEEVTEDAASKMGHESQEKMEECREDNGHASQN